MQGTRTGWLRGAELVGVGEPYQCQFCPSPGDSAHGWEMRCRGPVTLYTMKRKGVQNPERCMGALSRQQGKNQAGLKLYQEINSMH